MLTSKPPCLDKTTECALASVCVLITLLRKLVTGYLECDSPSTALTLSCSSLSRSSWSSLSSSFRCSASRTCLSRSSSFCLSTSFVARVCLAQIHKLNHSLHHIYKQVRTHVLKKPTPFSLLPFCSVWRWLLWSWGGFSSFCFISFSWGRITLSDIHICGYPVGHLRGGINPS